MPRRGAPPQRMLTTVLFTDIVGSTERAAEIGDRGWRQLLARHHAVVRRELKRHHGREVDTAGDGFFATFDQPAEAIQCAVAVAERLRPLGIEIRAGVHMGQVEVAPPKVQGIAVNIGARVAARAAPGQVLVSSTVRDALAGSDIGFAEEGVSELKGVPGEWRLFAVRKDDRLLSQSVGVAERPVHEAPEPEEERRPAYRRPVPLAIAGAGVVAVTVVAALLVTRGGGPSYVPAPDTVARIGLSGNSIEGGVQVGGRPEGIAVGDGAVWITNSETRTLQSIDPSTGEAGAPVGLLGTPTGIAVGGCCVWITSSFGGQLLQYDIRTGAQEEIRIGGGPTGVAYEGGYLWVTDTTQDQVLRIDTQTQETKRLHLDVGSAPKGIAVGGGSVWVGASLKATVLRIDPRSLKVTGRVPILHGQPEQVTYGDGYVWVTNQEDDSVTRIDPRSLSAVSIPDVGDGPSGIAAGEGAVFVANLLDGTVARIDPRAHRVTERVPLGVGADGVVIARGFAWVTLHEA